MSEARMFTFSSKTKDHLTKFRLTTSRAKGPQAVIYYIDKNTSEIKQDEDETVYTSLEHIAEDLPDTTPRYILLSYPFTHDDGRMEVPYVLVYYKPECPLQVNIQYAAGKELMRNTAEVLKVLEIRSAEELTGQKFLNELKEKK